MPKTAREGSLPPAEMPWTKRYRLLVEIGLIALLGGIAALVVGIILLTDGGVTELNQENVQRRTDLRPLMASVMVVPADLPTDWHQLPSGPGFQGSLRSANLGAATTAAESVVGNASSWFKGGDPRLLGSGIFIAESTKVAQAAFERLRSATPNETLSYVEPNADRLISVTPLTLASEGSSRFGFIVSYQRGETPATVDVPSQPVLLSTTVLWAVEGRAMIFASLADQLISPATPPPVVMSAWLDDMVAAHLAAEEQLAGPGGAGSDSTAP